MNRSFILLWVCCSALLLIGCSIVASPPKAEIDKAVDGALAQVIRREDKSQPLFDSYRLTNQYQEKRGERVFVYDFEADCRVVRWMGGFDNYGVTHPDRWGQATDPRFPGEIRAFKGSVTLVKKGEQWYAPQTRR
jgi:hypothetical protein